MKKSYFIAFMTLIFITGCSKTSELNYDGKDLLYPCTSEDVTLFEEDVNVNITDKQSFILIDSNSEMTEYTNGLFEFKKEDGTDIKTCLLVMKK